MFLQSDKNNLLLILLELINEPYVQNQNCKNVYIRITITVS